MKDPIFKITALIWITCTIISIILLAYISNLFSTPLTVKTISGSENILTALSITIILSIISFFITATDYLMYIFEKSQFHINKNGLTTRILNSIIFIFFALLLPIFLLFSIGHQLFKKNQPTTLQSNKTKNITKISLQILGIIFLLTPLWAGLYYVSGTTLYQTTIRILGHYEDDIPLAGTGSMYPTFPKGQKKTLRELANETVGTAGMQPYPNGIVFWGKRYYGYEIGYSDIVSFSNNTTFDLTRDEIGESGFVKRVIGLPGDTIEIRDGIVYRNSEPLQEQYIAQARSTFGGDFLPECTIKHVPDGKLFVMGDNRKGSLDSRFELGFIAFDDIDHVIPYEKQKGILDKFWRDTSKDLEDSSKITLNKTEYLKLINQKRSESGVPPLSYQQKLEVSSAKRAHEILINSELERGINGEAMKKTLSESGFLHYNKAELPRLGHYESIELFENQFEFPSSKNILLSNEYKEIGISEFEESINGCPTQVIVQHLVGYVAPNYPKEDIDSFKSALERVKSVKPGWESLKQSEKFYAENKSDVDRILQIIGERISHLEAIVKRMEGNEWLTNQENEYVDQEGSLYNEQQQIAERLNSKI